MRTQFSRRPKFLSPGRSIALALLGAVLFIALLLRFFFPGILVSLSSPLFSFGTAASSYIALPGNAKSQAEEIERLRKENATLAEQNATLAARLKDLHAASGETGIVAGVLAGPPQSPYDALIVGAGEKDGIHTGMRVLSGGVPVGTVESVAPQSSRIALYSAPGTETAGWAGDKRIALVLHGEGGGVFSADVPKDAGISEGVLVYLPGPGALPVGTVVKVETDPSSPRATLRIRPVANPFSMTAVEITSAPL